MQPRQAEAHVPRWYLVPLRVLLVGFFVTLVAFAISLFGGIWVILIKARLEGVHPNMTVAYRHVALPIAAAAAVVAIIVAAVVELRHFRQGKALAEIANASR